jgi:hypothetical protein
MASAVCATTHQNQSHGRFRDVLSPNPTDHVFCIGAVDYPSAKGSNDLREEHSLPFRPLVNEFFYLGAIGSEV